MIMKKEEVLKTCAKVVIAGVTTVRRHKNDKG